MHAQHTPRPKLPQHPHREQIVTELHARPFESIASPVRASHIAMHGGDPHLERLHVAALCQQHGSAGPADDSDYLSQDLGPYRLRWERHTEFSTYTFFAVGAPCDRSQPFADPALQAVPQDWLEALPGHLVAAAHLTLCDASETNGGPPDISAIFGHDHVAGSLVADGLASVYTDFRQQADGHTQVLIDDHGLAPRRAGRLIQRLLEIETYRLMALLALPLARDATRHLTQLDRDLESITQQMTESTGLEDEQRLLDRISALSANLERTVAANSFRLSAARAYHALVNRRIDTLREERLPELQTIAEFLQRRFNPAMRTCESVDDRQEVLSRRVSRAANLLRTRVDVALEAQNRDLLASMNRRTDLQLRLQQTVEGLSVVVLSYYGSGLLAYLYKGAHAAGAPINVDLAMGLSIPLVVLTVWLGIRFMRRRLFGKKGH